MGREALRRSLETCWHGRPGCGAFFSSFVLSSSWKPFALLMVTQSPPSGATALCLRGEQPMGASRCASESSSPLHHPLAICSPSATVCPLPTPLFTPSPPVCPSHTVSKSRTLFHCTQHSTRTRKLYRLFNEGRDGDKGLTCLCLQKRERNTGSR